MQDSEERIVIAELRQHKIAFRREQTGGGHIAIRWQISQDKQPRVFYAPNSGSDFRGRLNARADVRRMLRADGVNLDEVKLQPKPQTQLAKALHVPEPQVPIPDQIKIVRQELGDLTELMLDLSVTINAVKELLTASQSQTKESQNAILSGSEHSTKRKPLRKARTRPSVSTKQTNRKGKAQVGDPKAEVPKVRRVRTRIK